MATDESGRAAEMIVSLWQRTSQADPEQVGEVSYVAGEIRLAMDEETARFINNYACFVPGGILTIKDGRRWLEELPLQLRGTYFWASADSTSEPGASAAPSRKWRTVDVPPFYEEEDLREWIAGAPAVLPSVQRRPAVAATEVGVPQMAGRIDVLVVDVDGSITVVECKLSKNPEQHAAVVGQVLSYAAGLSGLRYDQFRQKFEARGISLTAAFESESRWDKEVFDRTISQNLGAGRLHLVIAADETSEPLRRTLEFVRERMPGVDLQLLEFPNVLGPPPKRPEELIEAIRALNVAAGDAAKALWVWAEDEPRLHFELRGHEGVIRARETVCRIKRHRTLRVSLDTVAGQLGPRGEARVEQLGAKLQNVGFELRGEKARIPLEALRVQEFLELMGPVVEELPNAPSRTDSDVGRQQ